MKKLFERNDLLIVIAVCIITIILLIPHFTGKKSLEAEIAVDGEVIKTISLNDVNGFYEFTTDTEPSVTISAEKGRIRVSDAECPDKLCVNFGWLDSDGDMAVCLPAKVTVSVKGAKSKDAPDVITY